MTAPRIDLSRLRHASARSGAIALSTQAAVSASQLAALVVLARLLAPADFGIVGMVAAITAFATIFRDLGLSTAVVRAGDLTQEQQSTLYWVNVASGAGLSLLMAAAAPLVGLLYDEPRVVPVMRLLCWSFLIASLGAQHGALLQKQLAFSRKAAASIGAAVTTLAVSIALAMLDYGYWALAWGSLAGTAVSSALLVALSGFRPSRSFSLRGVRGHLGFGSHVVAFDIANYFHRNFDNLLVGRSIGADALGIYTRAYQLSSLPTTLVRNPIMSVALPALSRLASQPGDYRAYFVRVASLMAFLTMPLMAFMVAAAEPMVTLALGPRWDHAVIPFALLSIAGFVQPVAGLRGTVMLSTGHSLRYVHWGVVNAVCMVAGFLVGVRWGLEGVALAYALVANAILWPSLKMAFRGTPVQPSDFFRAVAKPALASLVAAGACWLIRASLPHLGAGPALVAMAFTFLAAFLATFVLSPGGMDDLRHMLRLANSILRPPASTSIAS